MTCDRGDFTEYSGIRRELSDLEKLNRKDANASRATREQRQQQIGEPAQADAAASVSSVPRARGPRALGGAVLEAQAHRSTRCASRSTTRTGTVARIFDRVVDVLARARLRRGRPTRARPTLTPAGRTMRRIYGERDLLVAESLRIGHLGGSGCRVPRRARVLPGLRAAARRRPGRASADCRADRSARRSARPQELWQRWTTSSRTTTCPGTEPISAGLAQAMHSWARGMPLDRVLDRGRHGRGRLRALGEADDRPARSALARRRRRRSPRPRARRSTRSAAASSRTPRSDRRPAASRVA